MMSENIDILLVTGNKAYDVVKEQSNQLSKLGYNLDVKKLQTDVAAFIEPKMMSESVETGAYDYVIVPGRTEADFSGLSNVFKGPKNAFDICEAIEDGLDELSPRKAADKVIDISEITIEELKEKEEPSFTLNLSGLEIGKGPATIIAEINNAATLETEDIHENIRYFLDQGADIIDLGFSNSTSPEEVEEVFKVLDTDAPLSIDTLDPEKIRVAVDYDIDLVLSANKEVMDRVGEELGNEVCVVIPDDETIGSLLENLSTAEKLGIKTIADPILSPPNSGLVDSIQRCHELNKLKPGLPTMMGVGNVTELIDADSLGINALMANIVSELSVDLLLTTEASLKTKGSVRELNKSCKMAYISKMKETYPKDLNIDLLNLKTKKRKEFPPEKLGEVIDGLHEKEVTSSKSPKGCFEIGVDREKKEIIAVFHSKNSEKHLTIKGRKADQIIKKITKRELIEDLNHSAYLGQELKKAEIALKTGKNYIQDEKLLESL
ncbi:MAG: Dihydropteroate synthase FolP [Candidatus Methanohalarchaeum thermophilum]|uniref:Dihydropteroate synthase FolP n=1 Tax=Methanohalarchaeum thermophilum TaxID=1903181 RepID=A0A1Q6DXV2_METT1|nr:MAG: Dihydropteroate synthase FolP [Candidatus Methanohalarchaeum thermophilum]